VIDHLSSLLSVLTYLQVNLQHGLILEHQQAFQDYKAQTASKLKDLEDLQERVSRLTLEKGNFRGEIDKYAQLLEREQTIRVEDLKKAEALQKELESLVASKKQLLTEVAGLQKTISDLQEKMQGAAQGLTDRFTAELKEKTDLLAKETTKAASLNTLINNLKSQESNAKMEIAKVKAESKLMSDKYNRMAAEHSQAFSVRKDIVLELYNN
jgi:chromosome segregation ATPase